MYSAFTHNNRVSVIYFAVTLIKQVFQLELMLSVYDKFNIVVSEHLGGIINEYKNELSGLKNEEFI